MSVTKDESDEMKKKNDRARKNAEGKNEHQQSDDMTEGQKWDCNNHKQVMASLTRPLEQ